MSDTEAVALSNDETKNQGETDPSLEKSSTSESSCMLDSFRLRYRQENGSPALDNKTGEDKLVTNFSSSRWGVGISSGTPSSSLAASTSPKARPPTWTVPLPPKEGLLAPSTSASFTAGPSVPDVATFSKSRPSDLDDSTPSKARLFDRDASTSPKAGSSPQDTPESKEETPSMLRNLLSAKIKPFNSIETESSIAPTLTSNYAILLESESSAESKLVQLQELQQTPSTSASFTAGPSVPDDATSSKSGPSDLDDSAPPNARLFDRDASASPKAESSLQDTPESTNVKSPILKESLSAEIKPTTSIETESSTAPALTSTDAPPLEAESSAGSKLVIFSPTIQKATHNWKNQVSVRMQNSFTAAKSALESGQKFHHDIKNKPCVELHKVRRFRTTDRKSSEEVSQVSQTSSQSDRISPSVSASASSTVGCIPRNTGKQFFDSLRSFLPQWIFIRKVPPQEPESNPVSPAQQKLLNEAFNRRLFENEKKQQTGLVMSSDQSSPLRGAEKSVPEISPSADETQVFSK